MVGAFSELPAHIRPFSLFAHDPVCILVWEGSVREEEPL